jgi:acetylornithine/succinyldiaminopimelate/putrescine aminotransferase
MTNRQLFLQHVGQTSPAPLALDIVRAKGCLMWDAGGKEYLDLISGISVCNIGHGHPAVIEAIKKQCDEYMHLMVYGELVQSPQVLYAKQLTDNLPSTLNSVFFTASGTEATEGAMKLAKRFTGRPGIISFNHSYHGSTQGALSVMGSEKWKQAFRPLLPGTRQLNYNSFDDLKHIGEDTACVILETVQAEAGVNRPDPEWIKAVREKCSSVGALMILDEIQCGFGRTGTLWGFQQYHIVPDILLLGKALGGGMPLGAFIASRDLMGALTHDPVLGHINTFGGHPVCCAAGKAALEVLLKENITEAVNEKSGLFVSGLKHPRIEKVTAAGLLIAVHFKNYETNRKVIDELIERGFFTDWFLFADNALRLAPPLIISAEQIQNACQTILSVLDELS